MGAESSRLPVFGVLVTTEAAGQAPPATLVEALVEALSDASAFNGQDQTPPAAVLWTDKEEQWKPLLPRLREAIPHLLTLGAYAPELRQGPAIWMRCALDRTVLTSWPEGVPPVLYLPGVSRGELRAVDECPVALQPLAELQYRGVWFTHENTRDWTPVGFLTSTRGGLGLEVAGDTATREAVAQALEKLADAPLAELRGHPLYAADFHALLQPDLVRQLLRWLDDPLGTQRAWSAEEWQVFRSACQDRYGFDPEADGELVGAERLGGREGAWDRAWSRFCEAPAAYPGVPELLRRAKPREAASLPLFSQAQRGSWPQDNDEAEAELRTALLACEGRTPADATRTLEDLEKKHAPRRTWVWAQLGQAPLAQALERLVACARGARVQPAGSTVAEQVASYVAEGWRVDGAALEALGKAPRPADASAVSAALRAVYRPWLEAAAERFQRAAGPHAAGYVAAVAPAKTLETGACVVFADGLRFDLGRRLRERLERTGLIVDESWRLAPLPTVTPTAKPAASPVANRVTGMGCDGGAFEPLVAETGQPLTIDRFRKLLDGAGVPSFKGTETGDPRGRGWTEAARIDERGHDEGVGLATHIDAEIDGLADRVRGLFEAGWSEVSIVTDHGWLLLPGGLPRVDLPGHLVKDRWTRCAVPKTESITALPTVPWYWNAEVSVLLAPGIASFIAGTEYSHGGLSLQECVVPTLRVRASKPSLPAGSIDQLRWIGMRCHAEVSGAGAGWSLDIRTKPADPGTSLGEGGPKPVAESGKGALVIGDPDLAGTAAVVVLLDPESRVIAKCNTTVGGD